MCIKIKTLEIIKTLLALVVEQKIDLWEGRHGEPTPRAVVIGVKVSEAQVEVSVYFRQRLRN